MAISEADKYADYDEWYARVQEELGGEPDIDEEPSELFVIILA